MYHASFLVCLVGRKRMGTSALSLRSTDQKFGCWCGYGKGPHFDVFVWRCWANSALILLWRLPSWRRLLMLLVPIRLLRLCMEVHMCWQRLFASYLGSEYCAKIVDYPTFDLRLLKRCLQRTAASVFGSLNPFSMTEFVVNRLKGAQTRDWMASRPALRKAIITNGPSMPGLVYVVAVIVGVRPLVVSHLKETGRIDDGYSLVVRSSTVAVLSASWKWAHHFFVVLEEGDRRVSIPQSTRADEVQDVPSSSRNL